MNFLDDDDRLPPKRLKLIQRVPLRGSGERPVPRDIATELSRRVIGQPQSLARIVPYVHMYQAGLAPEGRPAGVFLLLGPTGTGKTKTVEALADVLHGNQKNLLRVDCGEFQMEHEVAKLVGAPPGYLGHRETQPMLTQARLAAVASERSSVSIVLFDEIEKAAPSMTRLLLGILDKATLRLGDNNVVNFEKSLIFLTSNLGATSMMKELNPQFGLGGAIAVAPGDKKEKLEAIAMNAVRRQFSPEFVNRVDAVVTYQPLGTETLRTILDQQLTELQAHIRTRLGEHSFDIEVPHRARLFLLERGTSLESGAREIKRTLHRHLTQPLSALVAEGKIKPGGRVVAGLNNAKDKLRLKIAA